MKLTKKLAIVLVMMVLAFSLTGCATDTAGTPAEIRTTIVGEWKLDLEVLNQLTGVEKDVFDDIAYRVEDLSVVIEFTDDIADAAEQAAAAHKEAEAAVNEAKKALEAATATAQEDAGIITKAEEAVTAATAAAEEAAKKAEEAAKAAAEAAEAAKNPADDFVQTGKLLVKVTAGGETAIAEDPYTATYEAGNYRVSINGAAANYFRIDDGQLVIVNHEAIKAE